MAKSKRFLGAGIAGLGRTGWNNHALTLELLKEFYSGGS